ncbi:cupin domain-containing protein [Streptomyces sp. 150FB]|uniref:cupin domain-containing protein n=1 Tax=Streptomyces sp. 150FB TaxID=1576605 RepID=UPI00099E0992|nr:cupin domain-containing protein [Streptomyces sp. 150FB]
MNKPELEFHIPSGPWETPEGAAPGVRERTAAADAAAGHRTALVRWEPGTDTSATGVSVHPHWEEVYILDGAMRDLTLGQTFGKGCYACRPPGMEHGPWIAEEGVTMLVLTYPDPDTAPGSSEHPSAGGSGPAPNPPAAP